ncbi:hypothetical protein ANTPLA_LOCUS10644 [Anthophora plagiata]
MSRINLNQYKESILLSELPSDEPLLLMLRVKKIKERDGYRSNSPEKQRGRSKKYTSSLKLFAKNCSPKVMIYRNNSVCKQTKDFSRTSGSSFLEESLNKLQVKEEKVECEHVCYNENGTNFAKGQDGVYLISSSNETQTSFEVYETLEKTRKTLKNDDEPIEESGFDSSAEESVIFGTDSREKLIFIDLTADEKNTWKQTILKRFCDAKASTVNETENENEKHSTNVALEPRIMIADNSTKLNCNGGNGSLATALRDRGPCIIPVQPNRSLPILPAPSVPTRSVRKDCSPLLILPKSTTSDTIEVESKKLINTLSNEKIHKEKGVNFEEGQMASRKFMSSLDYVFPQISSVRSLTGMKRKNDNGTECDTNNDVGNRKKKKLQEIDSSRNKTEGVESSIKEFLTNFCGSNATTDIQNLCTNKCARVVTTKEENDKLVPPLRLKKIERTETKGYSNSQITTGIEYESNYRIVTGATPRPTSSPSLVNWNEISYEKSADTELANTDSYKLKYRRNRLKQKLCELRSKSLELAKQMANDTNSQQSTKLRQVMNRYEKQIENLSKLYGKLSAALPVPNEVFDVNNDNSNHPGSRHPFANMNETILTSMSNNSPVSSPEPPKLSPRSPLNYDNILPEEVRNSPPILPRVCLTISSNEDLVDEELQITKRNVWSVNEESTSLAYPSDSPRNNYVDNVSSDSEKHLRTTPVGKQNNISFDTENSNLGINKGSLDISKNIQFPENNHAIQEERNGRNNLAEEFPQNCLMIQESEKFKCHEFSNPGPVISSVTSGLEMPTALEKNEMFKITSTKQLASSREHILQRNSYESNQHDVSTSKDNEDNQNTQKVTSSSGQSTKFDTIGTTPSQENFTIQQDYKREEIPNDTIQKSSHSITEQFPTLGNWLARMSKKQTAKAKSKVQTVRNFPCASTEDSVRVKIPGPEIPKMVGPNITNNIMNTTPQCNTEIWQYHHHQQQRQQLLQHVAASVTLSQPVATTPSLRSSICTSMPMAQFYPNNYTIDPYNSTTLNYHPPICPYGTYPYHSRLHSTSLPGYFPVQDSLRSMQHMDKRFSPVQDPLVRYPSPLTNTLQHPGNLEFDRLRGNSIINNVGTTTCLSSLFSSPPSLSSSHQVLSRVPLVGYSGNNQFSRNRMIPDVVAAAAAAAVAAAASLDRQCDTLTYNRNNTDALSSTNITNVIGGESPHVPSSNKSAINRDVTNQTPDGNFNKEGHENAKYQQMQNFLFDRLALVKTADNFAETNSAIDNDTQTTMTPTVSTAQYQVPLIPPYVQLSKNLLRNEFRNCKTPHLEKVNRSPNSSHNFTCSNCGIVGPMFKCLGCEMAFYCNEKCQEKHWYVHVQRCPKKMPKLKKVA